MEPIQLAIFEDYYQPKQKEGKVVNVSSVPQRSPFRYAGGKTWLVPTIRKWLRKKDGNALIEPFCGGGTVSLTAIDEQLTKTAIMIEKDVDVASVWETILSDSDWLINQIMNFEMSTDSVRCLLSQTPKTTRERAFQTIIRNRTNHGGIMAKGSGSIKNGENGKGIASRWYPTTLAKRIKNIAFNKSRIQFHLGDAFDYFGDDFYGANDYYFIDPPYTVAGKRLYTLSDINHEALFSQVRNLKCHFLMTYDKSDYIISLAKNNGLQWREIPMQTTHLIKKYELLISDSFDWYE